MDPLDAPTRATGMTEQTDLEERLRGTVCFASTNVEWPNNLLEEAADAIEAKDAEIARLERELADWVEITPW